jgi:hypothetical protein
MYMTCSLSQDSYYNKCSTTQWPKEKEQKDKQRSIKHTYKTKDRITRITPLQKKKNRELWGILFVEYLLLYSVTLTLNKSRVIKRCSIDVAIFVRLQEINEKVNIIFGAHDVVQE